MGRHGATVCGYLAGAATAAVLVILLGTSQGGADAPPEVVAAAKDDLAAADTQATFWGQELSACDAGVADAVQAAALRNDAYSLFVLDRAKGLATRAAFSYGDARLARILAARKLNVYSQSVP